MFAARKTVEAAAKLAALDRVQGVIEFDLSGRILDANANFLAAVGYTLPELVGQPHAMLVDPQYRDSAEYKAFWDR
ncbi:MAG: PAS domain S-box protein, partial [Methylobacterium sp.]